MNKLTLFFSLLAIVAVISCGNNETSPSQTLTASKYAKGSFGYDVQFLKQYHKDLVMLCDDSTGAQVLILPAYQGRVMTSTTEGLKGTSFGWVNHDLIASGKPAEHIHAFGGEERFWLGPEGGQFSIFFKKGTEFTFDNWFVPKELDTEPFTLVSATKSEASFTKDMSLQNYSGTPFDMTVSRTVRLLNKPAIDSALGIAIPQSVKVVGFESDNSITNKGTQAWNKKTGLPSIWVLSMLNANDKTTIAVPYKQGDSANLGKVVTDDYFGKIPADRLNVKDGIILLKADATFRSKIGISPLRALPLMASYDAANGVLTIAQFTLHPGVKDYVNSLWKIQDNPFGGDAVNAYNDGLNEGKQLGKFYELESSSPAAALAPDQSMRHLHRTIHLKGSREDLTQIAMKLLGVGVDAIRL